MPNGESPSSPTYTYRPLSPEPAPTYRTASPLPVSIPCYQPPIVYVVQVSAAAPTPPTSECSSDAENQILTTATVTKNHSAHVPIASIRDHTVGIHHGNEDILILPLSPEPEASNHDPEPQNTHTVIVSPPQHPVIVREQSVITSTHQLAAEKKRTNRNKNANNKINNNNNETADNNALVENLPAAKPTKTVIFVLYQIF